MNVDAQCFLGELSIRGDAKEVRRSSLWLEEICQGRGVPADQTMRLSLCLNEALANVISHGGPTALDAPIHLQLSLEEAGERGRVAVLSIVDAGAPFDPEVRGPTHAPSSLMEAEPGGLGLRMIRTFSDELLYQRDGDRNRLTIIVRWSQSE